MKSKFIRSLISLGVTVGLLLAALFFFVGTDISWAAELHPELTTGLVITITNWGQDQPDTNPGDGICRTSGGSCTLRAAIQEANASPGADTITYHSDNSVEMALTSALPAITEAVTLNGALDEGTYMRLNGASLPDGTHGLQLLGENITLRRVAIYNFRGSGVWIEGSNNVVEKSLIGADLAGSAGMGNRQNGITIHSGDSNQILDNIIVGNTLSGVLIEGGNQNKVLSNNMIGYWPASATRLANGMNGVRLTGGTNAIIGSTSSQRNYIAGNTGSGIYIAAGVVNVTVRANYIGLMQTGQKLGNKHGVEIWGGGHKIGDTSETGNVIAGNTIGILLTGAGAANNSIQYNSIVSASGIANTSDGIQLLNTSTNNTISNNLVGKNGRYGIHVTRSSAACVPTTISSNFVGTSANTFGDDLGNGLDGIHLDLAYCATVSTNFVGYSQRYGIYLKSSGSDTSSVIGNMIEYNQQAGLRIDTDGNTVKNNILALNHAFGLWLTGDSNQLEANRALGSSLPSSDYQTTGIRVDGDFNTLLGSSTTEIAYHDGVGLEINGHDNTVKRYNIYRNFGTGLWITGNQNIIGAAGSDRNRISGNYEGVLIDTGASQNQLIGNYIGLGSDGTSEEGNVIALQLRGNNNFIGGDDAGEGNHLAYSAGSALLIEGDNAAGNEVIGNTIGPTITGGNHGIEITDSAQYNRIISNLITSNPGAGVYIQSGSANLVYSNTLQNNGGLGIDLAPAGVTINDRGDDDGGANGLQNFPIIALAAVGTDTRLQGSLNSAPSKTYLLQFFYNTTCDASGYGEGEMLLGSIQVATDSSGNAAFDVSFATTAPLGKYLTATARDPNNNTSEFSKCVLGRPSGSGLVFTVNATNDAVDTNPSDNICDSSVTAGEQCTLRAAIQQANATVGTNTIIVPGGTYPLTLAGSDDLAAVGDLDISEALTLIGAGADVTILQGDMSDRIFEIRNSAVVVVSGVTVRGGAATTSSNGGGFLVGSGATLNLEAVNVRNNTTVSGGGGGIYSSGTLTITNSAVVSNTTTANSPTSNGGGLNLFVGLATLVNTTISGNSSVGSGGGIYNTGATVHLHNVTVAYNTADSDNNGGDGGGLYSSVSTFYLRNTVVAQNVDTSHGSFPYGYADCAGTYTSESYNLISDQAKQNNTNPPGCTLSGGGNDNVGGNWVLSNYLRFNAGLGALRFNGGTTLSHAPIASTSALTVDAGNPAQSGSGGNACEAFDQRGQPRPIDGGTDGIAHCDRGAVELIPSLLSINDVSVSEGSGANFTVSLSEPAQIAFTVKYSTTNVTAMAGQDYLFTSGMLTFAEGSTSQTVSIPTLNDTYNEAAETFRVRIYEPSWVLIADGEGFATLEDGDPIPALLIADTSAQEGGQAAFVVTLNSPSGQQVRVDFAVTSDTATADEDFVSWESTLIFNPGEVTQTIHVAILDDEIGDPNETFKITLSNPVNATLGDGQATGTITEKSTDYRVYLPFVIR